MAYRYINPYISKSKEAEKLAAEYYFYIAYSYYILSNESRLTNNFDKVNSYLEASVKANEESYKLSPNMLESLYNKARALALLGKNKESISFLEKIIRKDGLYSIKVLGDSDFKNIENEVIELIKKLRDELYNEYEKLNIQDYEFVSDYYRNNVQKVIKNLNKDSPYLDLRLGLLISKEELREINFDINVFSFETNENEIEYHLDDNAILLKMGYQRLICTSPQYGAQMELNFWNLEDGKRTVSLKNGEAQLLDNNTKIILNNGKVEIYQRGLVTKEYYIKYNTEHTKFQNWKERKDENQIEKDKKKIEKDEPIYIKESKFDYERYKIEKMLDIVLVKKQTKLEELRSINKRIDNLFDTDLEYWNFPSYSRFKEKVDKFEQICLRKNKKIFSSERILKEIVKNKEIEERQDNDSKIYETEKELDSILEREKINRKTKDRIFDAIYKLDIDSSHEYYKHRLEYKLDRLNDKDITRGFEFNSEIIIPLISFIIALAISIPALVILIPDQHYVISVMLGIGLIPFIINIFVKNDILLFVSFVLLGIALFVPAGWVGKDIWDFIGQIVFYLLDIGIVMCLIPAIMTRFVYLSDENLSSALLFISGGALIIAGGLSLIKAIFKALF